jgi:hypothetical protein
MTDEEAWTNEERHIIPVKGEKEVQQALALIGDIVEDPSHLNLDWLSINGWAAVPVESGGHFQEREAEWFSAAALSLGCSEFFAIATEPLINTTLCYLVRASQEGFMATNRACAGMNYVLIAKNKAFAILLTTEDYFIVSGPKSFVVKAIGSSISTARTMFLSFSNDSLWPADTHERLLNVAKRYESYNG